MGEGWDGELRGIEARRRARRSDIPGDLCGIGGSGFDMPLAISEVADEEEIIARNLVNASDDRPPLMVPVRDELPFRLGLPEARSDSNDVLLSCAPSARRFAPLQLPPILSCSNGPPSRGLLRPTGDGRSKLGVGAPEVAARLAHGDIG